jgi:hypothetical protein
MGSRQHSDRCLRMRSRCALRSLQHERPARSALAQGVRGRWTQGGLVALGRAREGPGLFDGGKARTRVSRLRLDLLRKFEPLPRDLPIAVTETSLLHRRKLFRFCCEHAACLDTLSCRQFRPIDCREFDQFEPSHLRRRHKRSALAVLYALVRQTRAFGLVGYSPSVSGGRCSGAALEQPTR